MPPVTPRRMRLACIEMGLGNALSHRGACRAQTDARCAEKPATRSPYALLSTVGALLRLGPPALRTKRDDDPPLARRRTAAREAARARRARALRRRAARRAARLGRARSVGGGARAHADR